MVNGFPPYSHATLVSCNLKDVHLRTGTTRNNLRFGLNIRIVLQGKIERHTKGKIRGRMMKKQNKSMHKLQNYICGIILSNNSPRKNTVQERIEKNANNVYVKSICDKRDYC